MSTNPSGPIVPQRAAKKKKPAPLVTPSRAIVFGLLIVAIFALIFDLLARSGASSAFKTLDDIRKENEQGLFSRGKIDSVIDGKRVRELIGKEPDGPVNEKNLLVWENYTWPGLFNTYRVRVFYHDKSLAAFDTIELNPDDFSEGMDDIPLRGKVEIIGQ